jgi:chromosome segregation ATPase
LELNFLELDELVTKIINHIDDTKKDTIKEVKSLIEESVARSKTEILREVNVLLEEQRAQFNTFGEGLDTLRDQMNRRFDEVNQRFDKNDSEHQSMKLMIQELAVDQAELKRKVKDLEQEIEMEFRS